MNDAIYAAAGVVAAFLLLRSPPAASSPLGYTVPGTPLSNVGPLLPPASFSQPARGGDGLIGTVAHTGARLAGVVSGVPVIGQIAGLQASISPTSLVGGVVLGPVGTAAGAVYDLGGKAVSAVKDVWDSIF